ncbi:MAG: ABC transporter permease [Vicinamibacteria bacterium]
MKLEHWWFTLPLRLKSIFRRNRMEQELSEELQFHLDHKIEEGVGGGLTPDEARRQALRAMEGLEQRKDEMRDMRRVHWLTDFVDDVRFASRSLRRTPGLSSLVVITLALGIGMTSTPFSMVDALIFRPYPVPNPESIVSLVSTSRDNAFDTFSYREYLDVRDHTNSYDGVVASAPPEGVGFAADKAATPRVRGGMMVSGNYFRVLGVEPRLGRGFRDDEDVVPGRDAVVVLGPDFWKNEFSSDPSVVGRTVRLNGHDFTVIGVAPPDFHGMWIFLRPDFYMPLAMAPVFSTKPQKRFFEDRDDRGLSLRARLKSATTLLQAQGELALLAQTFERDYPQVSRDRSAAVRTQFEMRTRGDDINWKISVIFAILALAVLLVACTNVAGLLLSRARTRTREIAIRLSMGAGRFRLIRLLLTESLMLSVLGGLGGVAVGYAGIYMMSRFQIPTELPLTVPFRMDTRMLIVSLVLAILSAVFCGLAPALQSTRTNLANALKAADVDLPGAKTLWGRNALVIAQVSMSLMLLTAAFLMARSFHDSIDDGTTFAKTPLLMARFDPRLVQYDATQTQQFYKQLTERAREIPGVARVGLTQSPPMGLDNFESLAFVPDGVQMPKERESFTATMDIVNEGFFETMGIALQRGRAFLTSDTADSPRVAVVNEQFARHYWPNEDAVGKRIRLDRSNGEPVEIVGVAQTLKYRNTTESPLDFIYLPLAQRPTARMVLLLRTATDPLQWAPPLRGIVRSIDANLPISEMRTYADLYRYHAVEGPAVAIRLVGTLGFVGLLLASAGLYGLMAYNVSRRTREIGIRMAIGASRRDVLKLMMAKGIALVGIGTGLGLVMGAGIEQLMNTMLFNAGRVDIGAYLIVVPSMFLVTMLATYVPALKASRIAPTQALRYE